MNEQSLTLSQAVEQVLAGMDGPLAVDELCRQVLAIRPSRAKNPLASVRDHLRSKEAGRTLAFLDAKTVTPLRIVMPGVRFRVSIARQEAERGVVFIFTRRLTISCARVSIPRRLNCSARRAARCPSA
jgi:hypothetical protein